MRHFQTAVLERRERITNGFETEPFECAWAGEAIFFISVDDIPHGSSASAIVQISADGIDWMDEGTQMEDVRRPGSQFAKVTNFGGWLRLRFEVRGADDGIVAGVRLALKE